MPKCESKPNRRTTEAAIRTIADERAAAAGYWFDPLAADRVCAFFEDHLRLTIGGERKFDLLPWQRDDFLRPLYGWKRPDGGRRFQKCDLFVAKKNGKSTLAAGLALWGLFSGGERAEVFGVAHTREQAGIIYREAVAMARASATLSGRLQIRESLRRINYPAYSSFYTVLAGENCARGVEGINPSLILFDEIHVQRSRTLYDALTYASIARPNSLMLSVSTVGVADPTSIWWEQYDLARKLIAGEITDHQRLALIWQADEECVHSAELRRDPEQWRKANPSLGVSVVEIKLRDAITEAENSPQKLGNLLRYVFNIPTAGVDKIVRMDRWADAPKDIPKLDGRVCYGGLDMASSEDLTAFVLYFPPDPDRPDDIGWLLCRVWCPENKVLDRARRQMAHYSHWADEGWLWQTPGERIEHEAILTEIRDLCDRYQVMEIGFDKWNADAVIQPLLADGVKCVSVSQTIDGMTGGTKALLDDIVARRIGYDGNPILTWCLGNCAGVTKGRDGAGDSMALAVKFDKSKSPEKIDVAVAAALARGRALVAEDLPMPGVW